MTNRFSSDCFPGCGSESACACDSGLSGSHTRHCSLNRTRQSVAAFRSLRPMADSTRCCGAWRPSEIRKRPANGSRNWCSRQHLFDCPALRFVLALLRPQIRTDPSHPSGHAVILLVRSLPPIYPSEIAPDCGAQTIDKFLVGELNHQETQETRGSSPAAAREPISLRFECLDAGHRNKPEQQEKIDVVLGDPPNSDYARQPQPKASATSSSHGTDHTAPRRRAPHGRHRTGRSVEGSPGPSRN